MCNMYNANGSIHNLPCNISQIVEIKLSNNSLNSLEHYFMSTLTCAVFKNVGQTVTVKKLSLSISYLARPSALFLSLMIH